ncbi:MAG TPA: alpha/beta fold hydrolase [Steroidobacteraceae bacterium]|jgi:dipeptidyl aminopeptidase/acylaminoacyl peptidase|nr:alpha/beta fold hydrolase [Steroidobacteraceae bacterium]
MKSHLAAVLIGALWATVHAQDVAPPADYIKPGDNMVLEHVPPIPTAVADATARYGEYRYALFQDWNPLRREMIVSTRFANTLQLHLVNHPGGARQQLTFFADRVRAASVDPVDGNSLVFSKDVGGNEWYQLYRFDMASGQATLLTDGRSRNGAALFEHSGSRIAYTSTRRNNQDTDLYLMDIHRPKTDHMLAQLQGGGWGPLDFSRDGSEVLLLEELSINLSNIYIVNVVSGEKRQITAKQQPGKEVYYGQAVFTPDAKGIYVTTDLDSDFQRLAYFDLATMTPHYLTTGIPWGVEGLALSEDGKTLAFFTNENGSSKLYLLDTAKGAMRAVANLPAGIIDSVSFHRNNRDLGLSLHSAKSPGDAYSVDVNSGKVERWTYSETSGLNAANFPEPRLVSWKSFDGRSISGWLYRPDPNKFAGRRPVIVDIHGGPEGQARPDFMGRNNYLLNELGVAYVLPNVRGSTGYGKEFTKLDNGFHRDDTYKDIGALLDWIATQPELDANRIMVFGGSYGGHMTWATAAYYNDKIRCAMPIVGMSNLVTFLEHTEAYRRDLRRAEYGDERDPAMRAYLERIAPMNHLESMHKPIFAVVGRNDPRVPWSESRQIIDKLNAQGTPTWFMVANDEGHGYAKKSNNDLMFDAEVMFIKTYLLARD